MPCCIALRKVGGSKLGPTDARRRSGGTSRTSLRLEETCLSAPLYVGTRLVCARQNRRRPQHPFSHAHRQIEPLPSHSTRRTNVIGKAGWRWRAGERYLQLHRARDASQPPMVCLVESFSVATVCLCSSEQRKPFRRGLRLLSISVHTAMPLTRGEIRHPPPL